jgi:hypothetical protein
LPLKWELVYVGQVGHVHNFAFSSLSGTLGPMLSPEKLAIYVLISICYS